jgi:hypothetical protein
MSGGDLATFGLLESDDIHRWLDWIEQNDKPLCVFGLGESMGAALLLQSLQSETRFALLPLNRLSPASVKSATKESGNFSAPDHGSDALSSGQLSSSHSFTQDGSTISTSSSSHPKTLLPLPRFPSF